MNRRHIILASAGLALFAGMCLLIFSTSDPEYEGKPVSYWYQEYSSVASREFVESLGDREPWPRAHLHGYEWELAMDPLRAMGTNAVPYVVRRALDTGKESRVQSVARHFFAWLLRKKSQPYVSREEMAAAAPGVVKELEPPAGQLLKLLRHELRSGNPIVCQRALELLGYAGDGAEQAVPALVAALSDADPATRQMAILSLNRLGPKSAAAVPALMDCIVRWKNDTNQTAYLAALALGRIGSPAAPAAGLIEDLFARETNDLSRLYLAGASCGILGGRSPRFEYLMTEVTNGNYFALESLSHAGSNARPALPVLLKILGEFTNNFSWVAAAQAVQNIGVPPADYLPLIKARLSRGIEGDREFAAEMVLAVDPSDADALSTLTGLLARQNSTSDRAALALGRAGPAAKAAIPALQEAINHNSPLLSSITETEEWALKKILAQEKLQK